MNHAKRLEGIRKVIMQAEVIGAENGFDAKVILFEALLVWMKEHDYTTDEAVETLANYGGSWPGWFRERVEDVYESGEGFVAS